MKESKIPNIFKLIPLFLLLIIFSACSDGGNGSGSEPDKNLGALDQPCREDGTCDEGFICNEENICVIAGTVENECETDTDCPEGMICETMESGINYCDEPNCNKPGINCNEDEFCDVICGNGWCYGTCRTRVRVAEGESCEDDSWCIEGLICNEDSICETESCETDSDCSEGLVCMEDGSCGYRIIPPGGLIRDDRNAVSITTLSTPVLSPANAEKVIDIFNGYNALCPIDDFDIPQWAKDEIKRQIREVSDEEEDYVPTIADCLSLQTLNLNKCVWDGDNFNCFAGQSDNEVGAIENLSWLSYFPQLRNLFLEDNNISDITPLENLTNLNYLNFWGNNISNITPLRNLANLTTLVFVRNDITDITPLKDLTNLTSLSLQDNNISDITPLKDLRNLTKLYLEDNNITDITPLRNLTNLTRLNLIGKDISDITPLQNLRNLNYLNMGGNNISDITPLANLTNLTSLFLWGNDITDITPLQNLTNLTSLFLWGNDISDISALSGLTKLNELDLSYNQIRDIIPLVQNRGIGEGDTIYLIGNELCTCGINNSDSANSSCYENFFDSAGRLLELQNRRVNIDIGISDLPLCEAN